MKKYSSIPGHWTQKGSKGSRMTCLWISHSRLQMTRGFTIKMSPLPQKIPQRLNVAYSPKYALYQKAIRNRQVEGAQKMLDSRNTKKNRKI